MDLSIIILSYNTAQVTVNCSQTLIAALQNSPNLKAEIIVVDNASKDNSVPMIQDFSTQIQTSNICFELIKNSKNLGYPKGNNQGLAKATGKYILFLNSDVIVDNVDFAVLLAYFNQHHDVGALTVQVNLPQGGIDPASHRGFPTIWNSFCYFTKLEQLFGRWPMIGRFVGGYHLTYLDLTTVHEIDSPVGAFYLTRKDLMDALHGFDEDFFMYGEDLDMSFKIKELKYKIVYYPHYSIVHLKRTSGLKKADAVIQKQTHDHFYNAMKTFYRKHYASSHLAVTNKLVDFFIELKRNLP